MRSGTLVCLPHARKCGLERSFPSLAPTPRPLLTSYPQLLSSRPRLTSCPLRPHSTTLGLAYNTYGGKAANVVHLASCHKPQAISKLATSADRAAATCKPATSHTGYWKISSLWSYECTTKSTLSPGGCYYNFLKITRQSSSPPKAARTSCTLLHATVNTRKLLSWKL